MQKGREFSDMVLFKTRIYWCCLLILIGFCMVGFIFWPKAITNGVSYGLELCLGTLVPSTFAFVVLCSFCVHSGIAVKIGRLLSPFTKFLFRLPGCCGSVILLAWIGGYPTGARGICNLYQSRQIDRNQAQQLLYFCVNAGPAFTISVLGAGFLHSISFGVLIFISQTAASLLIGIALGIWHRIKQPTIVKSIERNDPAFPGFSTALIQAVQDGARGAVNLCGFVMLFLAFLELLKSAKVLSCIAWLFTHIGLSPGTSAALFPMTWEVTSGIQTALDTEISMIFIVFSSAFGGLCVLFQILAATEPIGIQKWYFFISRLIHGILTCGIFLGLRPFFLLPDKAEAVFSNTSSTLNHQVSQGGSNPVSTVLCGSALLFFCVVFLLCRKGRTLANPK